MRIEIRLTEHCNYNCLYCTDMHNNSAKDWDIDYDGLHEVLKQFDSPEIFIYGGEPTLSPQLPKLVNFLNNYTDNIIVQTNGSNPEVLKDLNIKINYSYHDGIKLIDFIKNVDSSKLNEIAYMDHIKADYKDYEKLKFIYDCVQFCPTINSTIGEPPSNDRLKNLINQDIYKKISNDEHFISNKYGSNWYIWANDIKSNDKQCCTEFTTIHIQYNKVYFCFNAMMQDTKGVSTRDYKYNPKNIKCPYTYCYFGMENWI